MAGAPAGEPDAVGLSPPPPPPQAANTELNSAASAKERLCTPTLPCAWLKLAPVWEKSASDSGTCRQSCRRSLRTGVTRRPPWWPSDCPNDNFHWGKGIPGERADSRGTTPAEGHLCCFWRRPRAWRDRHSAASRTDQSRWRRRAPSRWISRSQPGGNALAHEAPKTRVTCSRMACRRLPPSGAKTLPGRSSMWAARPSRNTATNKATGSSRGGPLPAKSGPVDGVADCPTPHCALDVASPPPDAVGDHVMPNWPRQSA